MNPSDVSRRARMVWRAFGAKGVVRRVAYVAQLRSGLLRRRMPESEYASWSGIAWAHRFDFDEVRRRYDELDLNERAASDAVARCTELLAGQLSFYGGRVRDIGSPPRWLALPDGGAELPSAHWTSGSDDLRDGDIKDVWEPSRFGFTTAFARAYLATGDDRWVEQWWQLFEDWAAHNPPNIGPNWRCGQESSLRAVAVCFALSTFGDHPASNNARLQLAHQFLDATRARVAPTVGYALSQRNNHAISELVFLMSVPGGATARWQRLLREAVRDQWYDDGSYSQQSLIYERLAIHALVWLLHVQPELNPDTQAAVRITLSAAADFIERVSDPVACRLPNSGANDGALLFDLDVADRWDAAPLLAMLGRPAGELALEASVWLPPDRLQLRGSATSSSAFVTLRGERSLLLTHVGLGRHRAGDDDQQAIELIIDGRPTVLDPGTFRYSGRAPWRQPFTVRGAHSMAVPTAAADDQALGRFLRESMPAAEVVHRSNDGDEEVLVTVRRDGACTLTRALVRRGDRYLVVDHTSGGAATVGWLFPAEAEFDAASGTVRMSHAEVKLRSALPAERAERADDEPCSGWWSPLYGERWEATMVRVPLPDDGVASASFAPSGETPLVLADVHATLRSIAGVAQLESRLAQLSSVTA